MEKIVFALAEDDTIDFKYGGVKWKIAPLPFIIKKRLTKESSVALNNSDKVSDLIDVAMDAVKYGLKGWDGLRYSNGEVAQCVLMKDKNGIECLDPKCIEMIYRTSAFDTLSKYCLSPNSISDDLKDEVEFGKNDNQYSPEPLDDKKK